ncbi:class I SAM-dependent methyltransferase [Methylobacterium sp. J-070]|uniref:class I SAM-dependent methyltransferase n=1 Tax=Methylobacterium sp. J-070 TaxID=2836650 RepID=UPI001FBBC31A|nr:class I SAM-dependent methyltransferase [Methylobacterium sp. J-070]MCJ2054916.1 class I SAM-dependent methyltransferase [Methylobacterium sp. J-070]
MTSEHEKYWSSSYEERQSFLKELYNKRDATDPYATSRDGDQRELEISAIRKVLLNVAPGYMVDLGCGNGYTLISVAVDLAGWRMEGVDLSDKLIDGANTILEGSRSALKSELSFQCGDAIMFVKDIPAGTADVILTERFLLNLPGKDLQHAVIADIHRALRPGGLLLMCEASKTGFTELNRLRAAVGLEITAETSADNISAIRFDDEEIERHASSIGFQLVAKEGFSLFFAISRVFYPAMISPEAPKFNSKANKLARKIQESLPLQPGIGSNVLWTLRKMD